MLWTDTENVIVRIQLRALVLYAVEKLVHRLLFLTDCLAIYSGRCNLCLLTQQNYFSQTITVLVTFKEITEWW